MNRLSKLLTKAVLSAAFFVSFMHIGKATNYTAVVSGNFSSGSTWQGGIAPSLSLAGDIVVIPTGIVVTVNGSLDMTGMSPADMLQVDGMLSATSNLIYTDGVLLLGSGTIQADSFGGDFSGNKFAFTGSIDANMFDGSTITTNASVTFNVANQFYLWDVMTMNAGTLKLAQNGHITFMGDAAITTPLLTVGATASLGLPVAYDVTYMGAYIKTGSELSGVGLNGVIMNMASATAETDLSNDLTINGMLSISTGILDFNGYRLTLGTNSDFLTSPQGFLKSNTPSILQINSTNPLTGAFKFVPGGNTLENLTINCTGPVKLGSSLKIAGILDLVNGKLDVQNNKLSLITNGSIAHSGPTSYVITGTGGSLAADIDAGDNFTYPVGTATSFAPCFITSKNNTVYNGLSIGVNPGVLALGTIGPDMSTKQPMVGLTWFAEHSSTNVNLDMMVTWEASQEKGPFDRNNCYISHLSGNNWDKIADTNAIQLSTGLYSITRFGITSLSPFAVFDNTTVGVKELPVATQLAVYPNPANGFIKLDVTQRTHATVFNSMGQQVITTTIDKNNNSINTSHLPAGVYHIRLGNGSTATFIEQ